MKSLLGAVALVLCTFSAPRAGAAEVIDDRGARVALPTAAQRIVTLAPHLAEIAFAAGAGERVVGVSSYSDFPPAATRLPVIASAGRFDVERILALRPDLALAWQSGNPVLQVERLEALGLRVVVTEPRSFSDVARILRLVGRLAGSGAAAEQAARRFEQAHSDLQGRYEGLAPLPVFLEIWHRPMITINGAHLIGQAIALCGGRNVFAGARPRTPVVSREQLISARPEAIITAYAQDADAWQGLEVVPAVRSGRMYGVDPALLHGLGPRLLEGASAMCSLLDQARQKR